MMCAIVSYEKVFNIGKEKSATNDTNEHELKANLKVLESVAKVFKFSSLVLATLV